MKVKVAKKRRERNQRGQSSSIYIDREADGIVDDIVARTGRTRSAVISKLILIGGPAVQEDLNLLNG